MGAGGRQGGRAGSLRRARYGRTLAGQGHAAVGGAAQKPAELRPQLENAAQGVRGLGALQVFAEIGVGGEEPVLAQEVPRAARGLGPRKGGEQGEQQELQRRRNPGVQNRPRPGARCICLARCGGLMGHHRRLEHRQDR